MPSVQVTRSEPSRLRRFAPWLAALGLAVVIWGGKLNSIGRFGADVPNWDQWDSEAMLVYSPYLQGKLGFTDLFIPHNEHRIVLTKIYSIGLLEANGQWDARLECVVNAVLHASLSAGILLALWPRVGPWARWALALALALLFGLPISQQNVLSGFHSQQYFLLWTSLGAIYLLLMRSPREGAWWVGAALAVLANFTMGSGAMASATILVALGIRWLLQPKDWRVQLAPAVACALALGVGVWMFLPTPGHHLVLRAQSVKQFFEALACNLQWPTMGTAWAGVVLWAPFAWLIAGHGLRRWLSADDSEKRFDDVLMAVGGWVLLQYLATAYARGGGSIWPASRYMDTNGLGLLLNAVCLARLAARLTVARRWWACGTVTMLWVAIAGWGGYGLLRFLYSKELPEVGASLHVRGRNTQAFVLSGDMATIEDKDIPYPGAANLRDRLALPGIRGILPAGVRAPLSLEPGRGNVGFAPGGVSTGASPLAHRATWGSWADRSNAARWESAPFFTRGGYLKIETSGQPSAEGIEILVVPTSPGRDSIRFRPSREPHDAWRAAYARVPEGRYRLVVTDATAEAWVGFSEPVEMASGSYLAFRLTQNSAWIISLGIGLLGVAALAAARQPHSESPLVSPTP